MTQRRLTPRPPTCFATVHDGWRDIGPVLGCPGCWTALALNGVVLGRYRSQRAARIAVERHAAMRG
jgi:hypothetical protein